MAPQSLLQQVAHRPWPLPERPWLMRQTWHDLVFLHWPIAAGTLRPLIPRALTIEEFGGSAWIAVTPFWMSGVRFRRCPALPVASRFDELNVRTYVTLGDRPGVWFFSLDAGSRLAVLAARALYGLPYRYAHMRHRDHGEDIVYHSERPDGTAFDATYGPSGPVVASVSGTLEHWLTERYCLYAMRGAGILYRADIHHVPWPLQPVDATLRRNDMLGVHGVTLREPPPHRRFARRLDVLIWPPVRLDSAA